MPAYQWASKDPTRNMRYSTITLLNTMIPTRFNGMTVEARYALAYEDQPDGMQRQSVKETIVAPYGDEPINWWGAFTMGGSKDVNLATAYRGLYNALQIGTIEALMQWFQTVTDGSSMANFSNFQNSIGLQENVNLLIKQLMTNVAVDLPNPANI
jgi:hypothetical protein